MAWTEETSKRLGSTQVIMSVFATGDNRTALEELAADIAAALEEIKRLTARAERAERNARCYANEIPPDPDLDGPIPVEETPLYRAEAELERCRQEVGRLEQALDREAEAREQQAWQEQVFGEKREEV